MRIRTESTEPILSGHGAEQRSMERNYHLLASGTPLRSSSRRAASHLTPLTIFWISPSFFSASVSLPPPLSDLLASVSRRWSYNRTPRFPTYSYMYIPVHTWYRVYIPGPASITDSSIAVTFFSTKSSRHQFRFQTERKRRRDEGVFTKWRVCS